MYIAFGVSFLVGVVLYFVYRKGRKDQRLKDTVDSYIEKERKVEKYKKTLSDRDHFFNRERRRLDKFLREEMLDDEVGVPRKPLS